MLSFDQGNNRFNFRVAGAVIHNGRVLLHRGVKDDFWAMPGGRAEMQETTANTIVREMKEELELDVQSERLLCVSEDFFEYEGWMFHELGFYYLISIIGDHAITRYEDEFPGIEDDARLIFRWFPLDELHKVELYPELLRTDLVSVIADNKMRHYMKEQ